VIGKSEPQDSRRNREVTGNGGYRGRTAQRRRRTVDRIAVTERSRKKSQHNAGGRDQKAGNDVIGASQRQQLGRDLNIHAILRLTQLGGGRDAGTLRATYPALVSDVACVGGGRRDVTSCIVVQAQQHTIESSERGVPTDQT